MSSERYRLGRLVWPLIVQSAAGLLVGNANVLMLSRLSPDAVGAVGVANQLMGGLTVLYTVVGMGTAILMSQLAGAASHRRAHRVARVSLTVSAAVGVVFSLVFLAAGRHLPSLLNLPPGMAASASDYLQIVGTATMLQAIVLALTAIAGALGNTQLSLQVALLTGAVGLAGTTAAVLLPQLSAHAIAFVAGASVLGQAAGLAVAAVQVARTHPDVFRAGRWVHRPTAARIVVLGGPAALEYISYTFVQVVMTALAAGFGASAVNARVILVNLTALVSASSFSIGQATQILTGYWRGAGETSRLNAVALRSLRLALLTNLALASLLLAFGGTVVRWFTADPAILALTRTLLLIDLALELGRALNHVLASALRGTGDVRYPAVVGIVSMWAVGVSMAYLLGDKAAWGLVGLWTAATLDETTRGLLLLRRWLSGRWAVWHVQPGGFALQARGEAPNALRNTLEK